MLSADDGRRDEIDGAQKSKQPDDHPSDASTKHHQRNTKTRQQTCTTCDCIHPVRCELMTLVHRSKTWTDPDTAPTPDTSDLSHDSDPAQTKVSLASSKKKLQKEVDKLKRKDEAFSRRSIFATRRFLFPLGVMLGVMIAFAFVQPSDIQDMHAQLTLLMDHYDINLPQLPDFDFSRLEVEWNRIRSNIPEVWKFNTDGREFQVGENMAARGLIAKYPVVLIPGVISTGLESWSTSPDYRPFFREKMWGGINMLSQVTFNREKWISAMMLDPVTGLDPPDAKIRAAEGIDAASSFIQGYWIWSKIVENLAVVNYDTNNLYLAPYDWRLSYYNLEERDGYFSKLKSTIEGFKRRQGKKTVIAAHSMGATVTLVTCFLSDCHYLRRLNPSLPVPSSTSSNGSSPQNTVEAAPTGSRLVIFDLIPLKFIQTSRPESHRSVHLHCRNSPRGGKLARFVQWLLLVSLTCQPSQSKAMSAFLSGEMKDTVQMNPAGAYVLERFFSRAERRKLFLSWAGSASMWIKGGDAVWGNATWAPDDPEGSSHSHGQLIAFRETFLSEEDRQEDLRNMTSEQGGTWVLKHTPTTFQQMMYTNYSFGIERDEDKLARNDLDHRKWTNPLEVRLPNAPSMKFYCVYGHGKETERSYWYARGEYEQDETSADSPNAVCSSDGKNCTTPRPGLDLPLLRKNWIDWEYTDESVAPKVINGVKIGEGDGTVSLISLGAMCVEGWKRRRWNPAGINVTTIELPHQPVPALLRGGANTSEHVDVLGSTALNEIIVKVATGASGEIEENFVSNIREYSRKMQWD
ncbi:hypothetical protein D9758_008426 [Tetrapyrgos nigripes]|uniref:Phospholipid:diacylglycerol acyltransferase n=1 Tax=Tetrapyrgos nigripes TaxID=182062 RepID=A0A8H5CP41_9AGAR|nr:hypothetical protein D9758_008426 [Tetrapyrgos nigripes]